MYDRGVKLINATCHYATAELDASLILAQGAMRDHFHLGADLARIGRDRERHPFDPSEQYIYTHSTIAVAPLECVAQRFSTRDEHSRDRSACPSAI